MIQEIVWGGYEPYVSKTLKTTLGTVSVHFTSDHPKYRVNVSYLSDDENCSEAYSRVFPNKEDAARWGNQKLRELVTFEASMIMAGLK